MPTTVRRYDRVLEGESRAAVPVREVFGLTGGAPSWVLEPGRDVIAEARARYGSSLGPGHQLFVAEGFLAPDALRDLDGKPIPGLAVPPSHPGVHLFFVDEEPAANWAHACRYLVRLAKGVWQEARHEWPPREGIALHPLRLA